MERAGGGVWGISVNIYNNARPRKRSPRLPVVQQQHTVSLGFSPSTRIALYECRGILAGGVSSSSQADLSAPTQAPTRYAEVGNWSILNL